MELEEQIQNKELSKVSTFAEKETLREYETL